MPEIERAIILAAGRGTRLGVLTANRPKPMVPLCGKPILERITIGLHNTGVREFLFVIGYRGDAIREYFGDGRRWGVNIEYVDQPNPNGTGAALLLGKEWANRTPESPVFVSYGDIYTDPNHYSAIREEFFSATCAAVIGINPVDDPSAGAAVYRNGKRITRVVEKPPPGTSQSNWNIAGVSVYGPGIWDVLGGLQPSPRGEIELTDAISALIHKNESGGNEVRACELRGYWSDIGTPEALIEAESVCEMLLV